MFPIIPSNMSNKSYTPTSAGYPGSSPYAIPSQPPFNNRLSRQSSQWRNSLSQLSPPLSPSRSRTERSPPSYTAATSRKNSIFSLRNTTSRSSSTSSASSTSSSTLDSPVEASYSSRHSSIASTSSLSTSFKSVFGVGVSAEERAVRKAEKARKKRIDKAEEAARRRAQDMEASALYMAWSMF